MLGVAAHKPASMKQTNKQTKIEGVAAPRQLARKNEAHLGERTTAAGSGR